MADVGVKLAILQRRSEFLRCRNGLRWAGPEFVIEAKARTGDLSGEQPGTQTPRFGFTVTKQLGGAVRRNRIKRRLKVAVRSVAGGRAKASFDYVVIARNGAETSLFATLQAQLAKALVRIHEPASERGAKSRSSRAKPPLRA